MEMRHYPGTTLGNLKKSQCLKNVTSSLRRAVDRTTQPGSLAGMQEPSGDYYRKNRMDCVSNNNWFITVTEVKIILSPLQIPTIASNLHRIAIGAIEHWHVSFKLPVSVKAVTSHIFANFRDSAIHFFLDMDSDFSP